MVFSILFCAVLSNHVYAFTRIDTDPCSGSFSHQFSTVWCTATSSQYFETTWETDVTFPITLNVGQYYLLSGGIQTISTSRSQSSALYETSLSVTSYIEVAGQRYYSGFDNIVIPGNCNNTVTLGFIIRGVVSPYYNNIDVPYLANYLTPIIDCTYTFYFYELSDDEISKFQGQDGLNDSIKKGNGLQEKGNQLQQEANETSKGILGKITDFFGSFFDNLKGLFVPEDGYFSDFFTRLNDFFAEKLGMLYAPIDMFITFLNTIKDASSSDSGITFPELSWDDTVIIPETKFSFNTITKDFPDLQEKIYFVTDVILVGAVLWLLQVKLKEVLEN